MSRDVRRLLGDTNARVTTLIDYYGLPDDFPELRKAKTLQNARDRATALEAAFSKDVNHPRFRPSLALHELEAWIFATQTATEEHLAIRGIGGELARIAAEAAGAEDINDGSTTHPSIRLAQLAHKMSGQRRYGKVADVPQIIAKAGLGVIRAACPHFAQWLEWLEGLSRSIMIRPTWQISPPPPPHPMRTDHMHQSAVRPAQKPKGRSAGSSSRASDTAQLRP